MMGALSGGREAAAGGWRENVCPGVSWVVWVCGGGAGEGVTGRGVRDSLCVLVLPEEDEEEDEEEECCTES